MASGSEALRKGKYVLGIHLLAKALRPTASEMGDAVPKALEQAAAIIQVTVGEILTNLQSPGLPLLYACAL